MQIMKLHWVKIHDVKTIDFRCNKHYYKMWVQFISPHSLD
jgi:hypothetical protein